MCCNSRADAVANLLRIASRFWLSVAMIQSSLHILDSRRMAHPSGHAAIAVPEFHELPAGAVPRHGSAEIHAWCGFSSTSAPAESAASRLTRGADSARVQDSQHGNAPGKWRWARMALGFRHCLFRWERLVKLS